MFQIFFMLFFCVVSYADSTKLLTADLLEKSKASDWREVKAENTLYLELKSGRVIIELAPDFAPRHVENIKTLAREKYWDGLAILRVQDNYVVQWGDPNAEKPELKKWMKKAKETLPAEFDRAIDKKVAFDPLGDSDVYAPEVGFSTGFPAARDSSTNRTWLAHCYAMVGAGRNATADSGGGSELYVVIGHSPRHLDRNVTLVGRVLQGIELLSSLPRGTGPIGFYEKPEQHVPIQSIRVASDLPKKERVRLEVLRTDTDLFKKLIEARRNRQEDWFLKKAGHVELCNMMLPVRVKK
jgi:peptidylprolyl isomerase